MNIVSLLIRNALQRPVTLRFPARPVAPVGYRGLVVLEPGRCTGCAICANVCTSSAIKFKAKRDSYQWSYDAAQCTYCGRCVDVCAPAAISMQDCPPPIYSMGNSPKASHSMERKKPAGKVSAK